MNKSLNFQTPLEKILQTNGKLTEIIRKGDALKKIDRLLQKELSEILGGSVAENNISKTLLDGIHVGSFEKGRLQLLCDNGAISTRLRYLLPELIHRLRAEKYLPNLVTIDLKLAKTTAAIVEPPTKSRISPHNSALLKSTLAALRN